MNPYGVKSVPPVDAINYSIKTTTTIDRLAYPAQRPKYYMQIDISSYHRFDGQGGNLFSVARLNPEESIILPLPQQLIDINQVIYDQTQLGQLAGGLVQIGASAVNAARGNGAASGEMINNGQAAVGGLLSSAIAGASALAEGAIKTATKGANVPVRDLANASLAVAGYTPNQFITILLKGPSYKRHTFTWLFSPRSEKELQSLMEIMVTINNAKSPGITAGGALFTFPKVFRVSLRPNSKYMYKFKPAVVESFTMDPTGGGAPAFLRPNSNDGLNGAAVYQCRLDLLELEYWLSGNYSLSNDPFDTQRGGGNADQSPVQPGSPGRPQGTDPNTGVSTDPGVIHQQGSFF